MGLASLFSRVNQFQTRSGALNVNGRLRVYLDETDDLAEVFDEDGTRLAQPVVLDSNGRSQGLLVDADRIYRLEVYDSSDSLMFTLRHLAPIGDNGGGQMFTDIVSTDGSIKIDTFEQNYTKVYDIGIAPADSPEFLEWSTGFRGNMTYGSSKVPNYSAGTMSFDQYGVMVYKDRFYHITNKFFIKPRGTGVNYETFEVALMLRDPADGSATSVEIRKWDVDTSLTDEVQVEMSFDLTPTQDGELYWEFYDSLPKFQSTDAWIQIHRVYSGINAVPDTCATKQWISASYQPKSGMSSYVPYSAIGHDGDGAISGINGSAIAGQSATPSVTYITTANTVEDIWAITQSGGLPVFVSAWGNQQQYFHMLQDWGTEIGWKAFGRVYDGYAQIVYVNIDGWGPVSSTYIYNLQANWNENDSSVYSYIKNKPDLSQYQTTAAMSGYLPNSASGDFYPMTGNPSGFLTAHQDISTKLDVTAFTSYSSNLDSALGDEFDQISSALDDKFDKSASADLIAYSALEYSGGQITGISGSAIGGQIDTADFLPASASGDFYPMTGNPSGFLTAHQDISDKLDTSAFTGYTATALTSIENDVSSISAAVSGITGLTGTYVEQSAFNDYSADIDSALAGKADASSMSSYMPYSSLGYSGTVITGIDGSAIGGQFDSSQFLPASASSNFYTTANESGYITTADLADYATTAYVDSSVSGKADTTALTGYQPTGDYAYNSSLSSKLDTSAFSSVSGTFLTAVPAGYATEAYVDSSLSGKLDTTAQVVTSTSTGNYTMGGFITTGVSAINTKALLAVSAGSAQCDSLGRTITATYQPTGAYIYESALGWAEV